MNIKNRIKIDIKNLNFYYSGKIEPTLKDISFPIFSNKITALIGESGCGKTTLLRCLNRIHDLYSGNRYMGEILFNGKNSLQENDLTALRSKIGMVFQKPTPFSLSIFENVAYGLKIRGINNRNELEDRVEVVLKKVGLFEKVKDKLDENGEFLSGGEQQRLCIARAVVVEPEVLLFDEPTSSLDNFSTEIIEEFISELKKNMTIVIVTHNMKQTEKIGDYIALMNSGSLEKFGKKEEIL